MFTIPNVHGDISIHALREEGDRAVPALICGFPHISIHALREEGDPLVRLYSRHRKRFLSTPSARRATRLSLPCVRGS